MLSIVPSFKSSWLNPHLLWEEGVLLPTTTTLLHSGHYWHSEHYTILICTSSSHYCTHVWVLWKTFNFYIKSTFYVWNLFISFQLIFNESSNENWLPSQISQGESDKIAEPANMQLSVNSYFLINTKELPLCQDDDL